MLSEDTLTPLESNNMRSHLSQSQTQAQDSQLKAHGVVLEDEHVEGTKSEDAPDCDVRQNASGERTSIDHGGTVPKDCDVGPCQGSGHNGDVYEARRGAVAEIQHGLVEHVHDEEELSWPEVASHPEHDAKIESAAKLQVSS